MWGSVSRERYRWNRPSSLSGVCGFAFGINVPSVRPSAACGRKGETEKRKGDRKRCLTAPLIVGGKWGWDGREKKSIVWE